MRTTSLAAAACGLALASTLLATPPATAAPVIGRTVNKGAWTSGSFTDGCYEVGIFLQASAEKIRKLPWHAGVYRELWLSVKDTCHLTDGEPTTIIRDGARLGETMPVVDKKLAWATFAESYPDHIEKREVNCVPVEEDGEVYQDCQYEDVALPMSLSVRWVATGPVVKTVEKERDDHGLFRRTRYARPAEATVTVTWQGDRPGSATGTVTEGEISRQAYSVV